MYHPLPQTTFTTKSHSQLGEYHKELESERGRILKQPYRTSQLVTPQPKIKPWEVNMKAQSGGKTIKNSFMSGPVEEKNILHTLPNQNAVVQRQQYNNPKNLYSKENVKEAIFVQTGVQLDQPNYNYGRAGSRSPCYLPPASPSALGQPIHLNPSQLPALNMEHSPTYHYLLELEGPGVLKEGVRSSEYEKQQKMQQQKMQQQKMQMHQAQVQTMQRPQQQQQQQHQQQVMNNQQQYQTYGFPSQQHQEIAQSTSFKRLERFVLMDSY